MNGIQKLNEMVRLRPWNTEHKNMTFIASLKRSKDIAHRFN